MNYKFPEIRTLDCVLPYVEGREEFVVAERDDYTVVNYNVETPDTFRLDLNGGAARRECRGIIFNRDGVIISRPFHKFANVGQWEETQMHNIDMSIPHVIMDKADGSMIRPYYIHGEIVWGTKMGHETEVALKAAAFVEKNLKYHLFAEKCLEEYKTPIFEYVGPDNRIVIDYEQENLILLAVRDMVTGEYHKLNKDK